MKGSRNRPQKWVLGRLPRSDYPLTVHHGRGHVSKRVLLTQAGGGFVNPCSPFIRGPEKARGLLSFPQLGGNWAWRGQSALLFICVRINISPVRGACREAGRKTWKSEAILLGVAGGFREQLLSRLLGRNLLRCTLHRAGWAGGPVPLRSRHISALHGIPTPSFLPFCVKQCIEFQGGHFSMYYSS